jgi:hypothetical protein
MSVDFITDISERFLVTINYTHPCGERYSGLVTRNKEYIETEDIPPNEDGMYTLYDLLTQRWIKAEIHESVTFQINNLKILKTDNPFELSNIFDENLIQEYNQSLILDLQADKDFVKGLNEHMSKLGIHISDENITYYTSLLRTHHLQSLSEDGRDDRDAIQLCMAANCTFLELYSKDQPAVERLDLCRSNWLLVINDAIKEAKNKLDLEIEALDKDSQEYTFEVEEIKLIKGLLDSLTDEYKEKLKEYESYGDILSAWPPLLLPAPKYCSKWSTLENTIDEKYRFK